MSMGVYIKNMKAPVTCSYCPLIAYDSDIEWNDGGRETQGAYVCVMTGELIDNTKREEHCPLVPAPPHGALMDRDDFFATCPELVDGYKRITDDLVVIPAEEGER